MEERKINEIKHYDKRKFGAESVEGFEPTTLNSFRFLYKIAEPLIKGKKVLDYGCGNGVHTAFLAGHAAEVIGIDLSENSLQTAKKKQETRNKRQETRDRGQVRFLKMDCEKMGFPDGTFDAVFDGGTFSSLDLTKALPEIKRVLKSGGVLVGIETFGHNPITNLKRKLNVAIGKRTEWAAAHIFKQKDIEFLRHHFKNVEINYFHIISWTAFPFLNLPGGKLFLKFLEAIDVVLAKIPFIKNWAFKIVFIARR